MSRDSSRKQSLNCTAVTGQYNRLLAPIHHSRNFQFFHSTFHHHQIQLDFSQFSNAIELLVIDFFPLSHTATGGKAEEKNFLLRTKLFYCMRKKKNDWIFHFARVADDPTFSIRLDQRGVESTFIRYRRIFWLVFGIVMTTRKAKREKFTSSLVRASCVVDENENW